ncbi:hypothetical protein MNV49_002585 [Pseudohyphozyma bogoriensis]|nr:hypothetical protein MNV49_002585 [Pseudohyphozyma bogoriensis]
MSGTSSEAAQLADWRINVWPDTLGNLVSTFIAGIVCIKIIDYYGEPRTARRPFDDWIVAPLAVLSVVNLALDWALTKKNTIFLTLTLLLMATNFAASTSVLIIPYTWDTPSATLLGNLVATIMWSSMATDLSITAVLIWNVKSLERSNQTTFGSRQKVSRIIYLSFATGSITTGVALIAGIGYSVIGLANNPLRVFPDILVWLVVLSCLVTLVARQEWRRTEARNVVLPVSGVPPIPALNLSFGAKTDSVVIPTQQLSSKAEGGSSVRGADSLEGEEKPEQQLVEIDIPDSSK